MASYKSTRNNQQNNDNSQSPGQTQSYASYKHEQKEQEKDSSKKVAKTAAKGAATYFGGAAGGQAVEMASKTKAGDAILNKGGEALNKIPGMGKAAKKLDDSGVVDAADKALDLGSAMNGGAGNASSQIGSGANQAPQAQTSATNTGTGEMGGNSSKAGGDSSFLNNKKDSKKEKDNQDENEQSKDNDSSLQGKIKIPMIIKTAIIACIPFFLIIILICIIIAAIGGAINDFTDFLGISELLGLPTGSYSAEISPDARKFYERVEEIKNEFSSNNKTVDPLLLTSVYHTMNYHNKKYNYDYMNKDRLREIANAMFDKDSTVYNEETFKNNLTNNIFRKYFPNASEKERKKYTEEVFDYIEKYYDMIEYTPTSSCSPMGSCTYAIKGFYIYGKGNVTKELNLTNLKVRLMESGVANGHNYGGTFGKPMDGEELVDFEKYILGVAYAEIGSSAPDEAIKAQMVAARSYILARATDMGGWRKIVQEGNNYILQVAGSTQDQVYCNPDLGCSSNNGQWGMVYSGQGHNGGYSKPSLPADSRLRSLANETAGEVLVNSQGYVIYSGYLSEEQNKMSSLARQGYNYKQILLEIYNSGNRKLGAADIQKMSCNNSDSSCANAVSGDYAGWRQNKGAWVNVPMGTSGKTISQIGCLATSVAIQIARSGVPTKIQGEFNPGTFVEYLNTHGGFASGGNFIWSSATMVAPSFKYISTTTVSGYSQQQKITSLNALLNQGCYVVAEVKGNTGQHWVAIDSIDNGVIKMMDPATDETILWNRYNWSNTSKYACFKVG